ncbi:MAG: HAMP domain-containing histidine kinase [Pedosphaera sp.]|nr:HAMP domain-containing histidine kinase [Pedosphaera sp.]
MKKVALLFVLAVLVPSVVLALLAARTLRDQQFVVERQQSLLCQTVTDAFAKQVNDYLAEAQREFDAVVEKLVTNANPRTAAAQFDERLRTNWPMAEVGFCVTLSGALLCPAPASSPAARAFCLDNGGFLANRESVEVYWNDYSAKGQSFNNARGGNQQFETQQLSANSSSANSSRAEWGNNSQPSLTNANLKTQSRKVNPAQQGAQNIMPNEPAQEQNVSKVVATEAEFRQLIGDATDGMLVRFLQNKLKLMFWHRLERDPQLVFGAQLDLRAITGRLRSMLSDSPSYRIAPTANLNRVESVSVARPAGLANSAESFFFLTPENICLVVLDDGAKPVTTSDQFLELELRKRADHQLPGGVEAQFRAQFKTDFKHPFVATEIGEALPHWEVAAYLTNPNALKQAAQTIRLTLGLLIALLLITMIIGSWLIVNDLNRQMTLARQKTDFVSNVSHELKTPLTSIRMFSELLAEDRVSDRDKQKSYLHIISAEAARLTRLINNVLDFARFERGEKKYNFQDCDLAAVARDTAESYRPHLENNGFTLDCRLGDTPLQVRGDTDALAQILVNLLSNAEKYSNDHKQIEIETARHDSPLPYAEVRVLDRGLGVPHGCEEKIFENFYRAHDSLASGIQGSGLGLTLARQMARAHGGDVVYQPREGGGSCFALRLPLNPDVVGADVRRLGL